MCTTSSNPTVLMSWTDYSQLLPKHDELEMSLLIINEFGMVCLADSTWGPTTRRKPLSEKASCAITKSDTRCCQARVSLDALDPILLILFAVCLHLIRA